MATFAFEKKHCLAPQIRIVINNYTIIFHSNLNKVVENSDLEPSTGRL